jgi:tetratricopeptide (TPR) repeat protein
MPPNTVWEWVEAYGAIQADPEQCFGKWNDAVAHINAVVDKCVSADFLEQELKRTRQTFACKAGEVIFRGSQWGALEEKRLGEPMTTHLDFGEPGEQVADWSRLLEDGNLPAGDPKGILIQKDWLPKIQACTDVNWKVNYFLALFAIRSNDMKAAAGYIEKSIAQNENAWNLMAQADICVAEGREDKTVEIYEKVIRLRPFDVSIVKTCLRNGVRLNMAPEKILEVGELLSEDVRQRPYVKLCMAIALYRIGRIDEAEEIIMENGGLTVSDAREGETTITQLYIDIQIKRAEREGRTITEKDVKVPRLLDLRMKV